MNVTVVVSPPVAEYTKLLGEKVIVFVRLQVALAASERTETKSSISTQASARLSRLRAR